MRNLDILSDMPKLAHHNCAHQLDAWVNAATHKRLAKNKGPKVKGRRWVCTQCVGATLPQDLPIFCNDNVVRCSKDFPTSSPILNIFGFEFTVNALRMAHQVQYRRPRICGSGTFVPTVGDLFFDPVAGKYCKDNFIGALRPGPLDTELMGRYFDSNRTNSNAARFIEAVYYWGGGYKLHKTMMNAAARAGVNIGAKVMGGLGLYFGRAPTLTPGDVLNHLVSGVDYMGIAFGSKLLRMLDPNVYVVLDAVLSKGFGINISFSDYDLLCCEFARLQSSHGVSVISNVGTLETSLFYLVQDGVSASRP
ncbi:hypothetical protein [Azohydromonas lata]|uniref:Uncharacterized protein n=1 Tax=Azohydromonas lata TaxID=45677 RepID=A0ABU5I9R1_9BURK|nr:hypothetical protein [Azohydromonas lata]MDZ5455270.1 hypothetical protein [Azohydromonas lata]